MGRWWRWCAILVFAVALSAPAAVAAAPPPRPVVPKPVGTPKRPEKLPACYPVAPTSSRV